MISVVCPSCKGRRWLPVHVDAETIRAEPCCHCQGEGKVPSEVSDVGGSALAAAAQELQQIADRLAAVPEHAILTRDIVRDIARLGQIMASVMVDTHE